MTLSNETNVNLPEVILKSVFISIVMGMTILGNTLVIACVCYFPRLHGRTNYLIVSLAVADWLVGTTSLPMRLAQTANNDTWPFAHGVCRFWIWMDMLCSAASIFNLTAISVDRLVAVVDPLKYEERMRQRHVKVMIAGTWLFALICASLSLADWSVIDSKRRVRNFRKGVYNICECCVFFLPLLIVLVNYGVIFRIAMKHAHKLDLEIRSLATNYNAESRLDGNHNADDLASKPPKSILHRCAILLRKSPRKHRQRTARFSLVKQLKATKTLAVVIGVFCVCWLPFFVIFLTFQHCGDECFKPPRLSHSARTVLLAIFLYILPVVNSAANPVIYTCFNTEFRRAFKRVLYTFLRKKGKDDIDQSSSFTAVPTSPQTGHE
ncbi:tyramine receptor 1-like [Xenia sp. Carnegie-2017]|uniref:tyramine receptor 1-like n=1 Tax=Xenia sp. Carnegie-2017 TaxID=2897299 RepID=UPI001F039BBC|nr:tyramine receptor 1-like [Xenia sp. Carnegie-2017]XP_046843721.1 tyramine receptor 1-like [Xenia sp. Carnegie-2017]